MPPPLMREFVSHEPMDEVACQCGLREKGSPRQLDEALRRLTKAELRGHLSDVQLIVGIWPIDLFIELEYLFPLIEEAFHLVGGRRKIDGKRCGRVQKFQKVVIRDRDGHRRERVDRERPGLL